MPISSYVRGLRERIGTGLLLVPAAAAIVYDADGRVLAHQRADNGAWGLPGGAIDPGEAPARAVVREVWEETGLLVRPTRLVAVLGGPRCRFTYPNGDVSEYTLAVFACESVRGVLAARDGESIALGWVAPDALDAHAVDVLRAAGGAHGGGAAFEWDEAWLDQIAPP